MLLIVDPDDLNQGQSTAVANMVFATGTGADIQINSATNNQLPALAVSEFFEVRDHSVPGNNGLYQVVTVNTSTDSYECDKVTGIAPVTAASEAGTTLGATGTLSEKSVHFDVEGEGIYLLEQGNLSTDGVTMLALHSFIKKRWKDDQLLIDAGAFPMTGISSAAGQWVFGQDPSANFNDWRLKNVPAFTIDSTRLIRNAGWTENNADGTVRTRYFNVTTLGTFEDTLDQAYYFFGNDFTTDNTVNYAFTGPVNEAVKFYDATVTRAQPTATEGYDFNNTSPDTIDRNDGGSFVTDGYVVGGQVEVTNAEAAGDNGTYEITAVSASSMTVTAIGGGDAGLTGGLDDNSATLAIDNSNLFTTSLRIRDGDANGKTFQTSTLTDAGESAVEAKIIKFPLANLTDLDISETDANIAANSPYTEIRERFLSGTYNREVDSTTKRDFGVVIDVGTYSQSNGVSAISTLFTSASLSLGAGEDLTDYTGGTLIIHEGTDQGTHTISGTPVNNAGTLEITLTVALTAVASNLSFTMERATPLTATKNEIYEKIQYNRRQSTDIDSTSATVIGKVAGPIATFVGPDLRWAEQQSTNPNGGGTGVIVEGFDANDTNNLFFFDNTGTSRNFPFVAAGTLNFNDNLVNDSAGEYWLYFQYTNRTTSADIDVVSPTGDTYDLEGTLGTYAVNDYIDISGFAQDANNGTFIVTAVNVSGSDYTVRKINGQNVGTAETNQTVNVDENPFNSPDAIIVDNNSGADIAGAVGAASIAFDFDYDNNTQGGRTAGTPAVCVLKAIGLETGQYAEVRNQTITRATGLSFSITASLERNYTP